MWRLRLGVLFLLLSLTAVRADVRYCTVCKELIRNVFYTSEVWTAEGEETLCERCHALPKCSSCWRHMKDPYTTLTDGRLICQQDAAGALGTQQDCESAFRETKRDCMAILAGSGVLPNSNIKISMADRAELNKLYHPAGRGHEKIDALMGLTASRLVHNDEWEHAIYILDNLSPARFTAVAAHEYAHAWINENVRKGRALDADSVEGFCEWIAYKVMDSRSESIEKKMILANQYTRGQVQAFLKADAHARSYDVIKWMKQGRDEWVDVDAPGKILDLDKGPTPSGPLWGTTVKTAVPTRLTLRGISGTATRRFALINDKTLQKNETSRVRVGESNVVVQCLSISSNSVLVKVAGSDQPTQLFLCSNQ